MNPCTVMGGFWFAMGYCLFGLAVLGSIIVLALAGFLTYAAIGSIRRGKL